LSTRFLTRQIKPDLLVQRKAKSRRLPVISSLDKPHLSRNHSSGRATCFGAPPTGTLIGLSPRAFAQSLSPPSTTPGSYLPSLFTCSTSLNPGKNCPQLVYMITSQLSHADLLPSIHHCHNTTQSVMARFYQHYSCEQSTQQAPCD